MGSHLTTATHRGPPDLALETAGGMELPLEVSPHGRVLPESAVGLDPYVIRELGVRALDGANAHSLADEVLQNGSLLQTTRRRLCIEHGFADRSL